MFYDSSTSDPFCHLHSDVYSLITQHLKGSDLLKMSEVSSSWYNMTLDMKITKKIQLNCDMSPEKSKSDKIEFIKSMKKSSREYRSLMVAFDAGTQQDTIKIMRKSAAVLERLEIQEIFAKEFEIPEQKWRKLEKVKLGFVSKSIFEFVLTKEVQLKTLILDQKFDMSRNVEFVFKFLSTQRELEVLYILNSWSILLFIAQDNVNGELGGIIEDLSPFQLKKLFIGTSHEIAFASFEMMIFGILRFSTRSGFASTISFSSAFAISSCWITSSIIFPHWRQSHFAAQINISTTFCRLNCKSKTITTSRSFDSASNFPTITSRRWFDLFRSWKFSE